MEGMWREALDEQAALLRSWRSPGDGYSNGLIPWGGRRTAENMAAYRHAGNPEIGWMPPHPLTPTDEDRLEGAAQVATEQSVLMGTAVPWAVTADMVALVNHAADTMPGETVERFEIPSANGFVYLEDAGVQRDRRAAG